MKSFLLSCALAVVSLSAHAQAISPLAIGAPIPDAGMMMRNASSDRDVSLNEAKTDKGLLVMFSCNTCPYVIKSQKRTAETIAMAKKGGIGMVIINSNEGQRNDADSYEAMRKYAVAQKYTVPYVVDENSQMANLFGATRTPEVFLFDKNGMLVYHGAMEDNPSDPGKSKEIYLKTAIPAMLAGQAVKPPETKSIGCSIKRLEH